MKPTYLILPILLLVMSSCYKNVIVDAVHPAEISIPSDLDTVVIIDRTIREKGNGRQIGNVLEGIVTGEPLGGDKYGKRGVHENMLELIRSSDRLDMATTNIVEFKNDNGNFNNNNPIKASILDSICAQYGADGVIALEYFDSDKTGGAPNGSTSQNFVRTEWRLYYPNEQQIIDRSEIRTFGNDYSPTILGVGIPGRYKSIYRAGAEASDQYIKRIVPANYKEQRVYYTKGSEEMKLAHKAMDIQDFNQAKYYWEIVADDPTSSDKLLRRVAKNLALAYEMEGDLEYALMWAERSYMKGNASAQEYVMILKTRINEQELIQEQMIRE